LRLHRSSKAVKDEAYRDYLTVKAKRPEYSLSGTVSHLQKT